MHGESMGNAFETTMFSSKIEMDTLQNNNGHPEIMTGTPTGKLISTWAQVDPNDII
jgi:hypothetical protein